jgi:hypothetical protein
MDKFKQEAEQEKQELQNQLRVNGALAICVISHWRLSQQGSRVICLIDGDGSIFSNELIADGQAGGHLAAKRLSDATAHYLSSNCAINQFQLWVYVFFNKRGLLETFGRAGLPLPKAKLDDFVLGFNQAAERFLMVDVGSGKEAADAKIKGMLEWTARRLCCPLNARNKRTWTIIFGYHRLWRCYSEVHPNTISLKTGTESFEQAVTTMVMLRPSAH